MKKDSGPSDIRGNDEGVSILLNDNGEITRIGDSQSNESGSWKILIESACGIPKKFIR